MIEQLWSISTNIQIVEKDQKYSFEDLDAEIEKFNQRFVAIKSGDVIAIEGDFSFALIAAILSLWSKGAVLIPLSSLSIAPASDLFFEYTLSRNFELLKNNSLSGSQFNLAKLNNEAGVIFLTSGSTGKPKLVLHNIATLFAKTKKTKIKSSLLFLKFNHFGGLFTLVKLLKSGSKIVIINDHNPDSILSLVEKHGVELLPVTPTFLALADALGVFENKNYPHLKYISYGTEVMPESLLIKLHKKLPSVNFVQTYGLTEVGVLKTKSTSSASLDVLFDQSDFQTRISSDNKLEIKRENSSLVEIIENGMSVELKDWLETGDIVEQTKDGHLKIISRASSIIIVGGEKVVPEEVEDILLSFKDVVRAYVYPKKNELIGMYLCADIYFLSLDLEESSLKKQIKIHCLEKLEAYKVPVEINLKVIDDFKNYSLKMPRV